MRHQVSELLQSGQPVATGMLLLTPLDATPTQAGTIVDTDLGPAGLAVRLTAAVPMDAARLLEGARVWVTARLAEDRLTVYRSVARRAVWQSDLLDLTGVAAPFVEHRRALLRAPSRVAGQLILYPAGGSSSVSCPIRTTDLSRGGCRVQLPAGAQLPEPGSEADVVLELPGMPVEATCEVIRTDPVNDQVVLRFRSLDMVDAERLHRHVLEALEPMVLR